MSSTKKTVKHVDEEHAKEVRQSNERRDRKGSLSEDNGGKQQNISEHTTNVRMEEYEDIDDEYCYTHRHRCGGAVSKVRNVIYGIYSKHKKIVKIIFGLCLLGAYLVYFGFSMNYSFGDEPSFRLLIGTVCVLLLLFWSYFGERLKVCLTSSINCDTVNAEKFRRGIRWFLYIVTAVFSIVYLSLTVLRASPDNAISLAGIAFFIVVGFLFSRHPDLVNWHSVYWGMMTQFMLALFILQTEIGRDIFHWLGQRVQEFMGHVSKGSVFVFGESYRDHYFAFGIMPQAIFLSATISVLYHFGVIQVFVARFGWFLSFCLGTSPVESINAAVNLFLGPVESPLSIKPFLPLLTPSELHAIMAAGFASIAGTVFGVIVSLGASPDHLLAATVMSAPAALAMSKLLFPETRLTRINPDDSYKIPMECHRNFIEAISTGAVQGIKLVASILVNQLVFVAGVELLDQTLLWFGDRAGVPGVSFGLICSYVFYPLAFLMGFPTEDLFKIGELMGIKVFANALVGFAEFGKLVRNRHALEDYVAVYNSTWHYTHNGIVLEATNTTLLGGTLSKRSEMIGVYAFCGLNHLGAIGVTMGVLVALVPHRKSTISKHLIRANMAGHIACFMTACIAGLLYTESAV